MSKSREYVKEELFDGGVFVVSQLMLVKIKKN